jgi:hypothetical protein
MQEFITDQLDIFVIIPETRTARQHLSTGTILGNTFMMQRNAATRIFGGTQERGSCLGSKSQNPVGRDQARPHSTSFRVRDDQKHVRQKTGTKVEDFSE